VAKTLRRSLLALPGRTTRSARRWTLHLPAGWPWAAWYDLALARLRCIAYATRPPLPDRASSHAQPGPAPACPGTPSQQLAPSRSPQTGRHAISKSSRVLWCSS
jgi:hypothetical protein